MRRAPLLAAVLILGCTPFGSPEGQPSTSPTDASVKVDGPVAPNVDAGTSDVESPPPVPGSWCADKTSAKWCFDFGGTNLGDWQWKGARWESNVLLPGELLPEDGKVRSNVPGWVENGPVGRANVFLPASFTSKLSFEWQFEAVVQGNKTYALIAEILETPSRGVGVYTSGEDILWKQIGGATLHTATQPASPTSFRLEIRLATGIAFLDISMGSSKLKENIDLGAWNGEKSEAGFGIGQVDGAKTDADGRSFRYDNVLVETQ